MRRLPSFLALRAFEAAARLKSFALAAAELHLTPSAISHQVKALEDYFGRKLFIRRHREVIPTADGEQLRQSLSQAFDAMEVACTSLGGGPTTQSLAVHCSPSFASKWLAPRLPAFMQLHPLIGIRLSSGADPVDLLRHEELDVLISYGKALEHPSIVSRPLGQEEITALAAPALAAPLIAGDPMAWAGVTLIESSVSPVRWMDWFALNRLTFPAKGLGPAFDRGALAISAALQGLGVVLESKRFAHEELASGDLVDVGKEHFHAIKREMHFLSVRSAERRSPKIVAFYTWLLSEVDL